MTLECKIYYVKSTRIDDNYAKLDLISKDKRVDIEGLTLSAFALAFEEFNSSITIT